jgi:hypothetical protein
LTCSLRFEAVSQSVELLAIEPFEVEVAPVERAHRLNGSAKTELGETLLKIEQVQRV